MKKVREVLEMKSKQERLSFVEKFEFWRVEVAECKKTMFLKTNFSSPLKLSFFFSFLFFAFHKSVTCEPITSLLTKCADAQGKISHVKFESQTTREGAAKLST